MKDAFWQIFGRMISAISGFFVVSMMTPLLWPLRYGDYSTLISYFALRSALADLGLYVIWLRELGELKAQYNLHTKQDYENMNSEQKKHFSIEISKFVWSRVAQIVIVYAIAIAVAYMIPSYTHNPYIARWLPLGMAFSALFMVAGIVQLPLQLFWKMEHVSIALVLARVSQIIMLLAVSYSGFWGTINSDNIPISLFLVVVWSVTVSSITQTLYTFIVGNNVIRMRWTPFLKHMMLHIKANGKYGAAFFLSSFHLLIVSLLISIIYPTVQWFPYIGIRWLALQLIQILLIIPAALANSLIHKISSLWIERQKKAFWHMNTILVWFGRWCAANFFIFSTPIISFLSGKEYLTQWVSGFNLKWIQEFLSNHQRSLIGADFILPWLSIVLALSFIKTIFNYVFVAAKKQNILFPINLRGVTIWWVVAYFMVKEYALIGWLFSQLLMEVIFLWGSLLYAKKLNILPTVFKKDHLKIHLFFGITIWIAMLQHGININNKTIFFLSATIFNILVVALWFKFIKWRFKSISWEIDN